MSLGVRVKVWGDYALFSRPEMKVERCSYDIITPSAARGILEAIYWHPGMSWKIDSIHVIKPISLLPSGAMRSKARFQLITCYPFTTARKKNCSSAARKRLSRELLCY